MSEKIHAVAARRIFDGVALRKDSAVVIEGDTIAAVVPRSELSSTIPCVDLAANAWLAPGFIDIQVNGGGDVLFNDEPTPDAIRSIAAAHRKFGTTSLLPTLISDSPEKMAAACRCGGKSRWRGARRSSGSISKGLFCRRKSPASTIRARFANPRKRT